MALDAMLFQQRSNFALEERIRRARAIGSNIVTGNKNVDRQKELSYCSNDNSCKKRKGRFHAIHHQVLGSNPWNEGAGASLRF
jgi:hypothetical protein